MGSLATLLAAGTLVLGLTLRPELRDDPFPDATSGWSAPRLASADFAGVVEVVRVGTALREYRVVDGWMGAAPGTLLLVRHAGPPMPPQPRFVALLHRIRRVERAEPSFAAGLGAPDTWRQLLADFDADELVPAAPGASIAFEGRRFPLSAEGLAELAVAVKAHLALPQEARELAWARGEMRKILVRRNHDSEADPLRRLVETAPSLDALIEGLDALGGTEVGPDTIPLFAPLTYAGPLSRAALVRHGDRAPERPSGRPSTPSGARIDLAANRAALADGFDAHDRPALFDELAATDPVPLARWLARWDPHGDGYLVAYDGYVMGSWFARAAAGPHRREALDALQEARDPLIRVASAIQLLFEAPDEARARLTKLAERPDDAGDWATMTLARRGDREAFVRVISAQKASVTRSALQLHLDADRSVLEASAMISAGEWDVDELHKWPHEWADDHRTLVIRDPWLPELAAIRCD